MKELSIDQKIELLKIASTLGTDVAIRFNGIEKTIENYNAMAQLITSQVQH